MDCAEFQQNLRRHGGYVSPHPLDRSAADRLFGWCDAWYYLNLIRIVIQGNRAAARAPYGNEQFSEQSFQTLRMVERSGTTVTIQNCEELARPPWPRVIVANHMSLLETFVLPSMILAFGNLAIVTRVKLLSYPVFGRVLRAINPIAVTRANPRDDLETVLIEGEAAIRAGRSVLVFPQSTRKPAFDPATFNTIGVKLARRSGVGIMPVALRTDFMGIGKISRDFGPIRRSRPVRVRFGPVVPVSGNGRDANERCISFIMDSLREWEQDDSAKAVAVAAKGGEPA